METTIEQSMLVPVLQEFREEAAITRRVLERVPADKLTWKPHAKSMSLGQLAWHVATTPGSLARLVQQESFDVSKANFVPPQPKSMNEILTAYEQSVRDQEPHGPAGRGELEALLAETAKTESCGSSFFVWHFGHSAFSLP